MRDIVTEGLSTRINGDGLEDGVRKSSLGSGTVVVFAIVVVALYIGRDIFVPLALAILLSFVLAPVALLFRRWHVGRVPSVIIAVVLAFAVIFGIGTLIGGQVGRLAENLPDYQSTIRDKIRSIAGAASASNIFERATAMLNALRGEITKSEEPPKAAPANLHGTSGNSPPQPKPVPVEIHEPPPPPLQVIQKVIGPLLGPLASTGIVMIFLIFILLQREDLRDRFIRLAGTDDLQRTTRALDDAVSRLSRYFLMQCLINAGFGLVIGTGLFFIDVPNPILWGVLAFLLRFVPYIGAPLAALFPAALAVAVDPGWSMLLWTIGLFLVVEPITGQLIEPLLYGHSTGLSAVAVVVSAVFWTWLWGPVGLLLSTPLTVCLVVVGRHVEHLQFLNVLLGDQPALTPGESFYQRMLAGNADEAAHQAEQFLKERDLTAYYDEVAIKGLALAQLDVNRGVLDHRGRIRIKAAIETVIDDLADHDAVTAPEGKPPLPKERGTVAGGGTVLCIAGRGSLDEAAAAMLAQLLQQRGIDARVVPHSAVSASNIFLLDVAGTRVACLSYLDPGNFTSARFLVRRLRRKLPHAKIWVGLWTQSPEEMEHREALRETGADLVVTSLRQAVEKTIAAVAEIVVDADAPTRPAHKVGPVSTAR